MGRELTPNRISFTSEPCNPVVLCGISTCFQVLSLCLGQIVHALLTRPPLEHEPSGRSFPLHVPARLACVKHAASVRPEPGSNSYVQSLSSTSRLLPSGSPKPSAFSIPSRRFTLSESDCFVHFDFSLYRFQGSLAVARLSAHHRRSLTACSL